MLLSYQFFLFISIMLAVLQVKMRNLEHQNGVLLAKYQAVMSMKDRRGPEGAQVPSPGLASITPAPRTSQSSTSLIPLSAMPAH